jgi:hypothetical protein
MKKSDELSKEDKEELHREELDRLHREANLTLQEERRNINRHAKIRALVNSKYITVYNQ